MAHTYINELVHCVFSTKERHATITPTIQPDLWAYIGGIARNNGMKALAVGGTNNHIHVLLSIAATMPVAKAVQLIKGGSSKWVHDQFQSGLQWQEGYGAFTLGASQVAATIAYINSQAEHHHKRSFEEEFTAFLKKNNIDYDPKFVFG